MVVLLYVAEVFDQLTDNLFDDDIPSPTVAFESYRPGDTLKGSLVKRTYEQALPNLVPGEGKKHKRKVFDCFETLQWSLL